MKKRVFKFLKTFVGSLLISASLHAKVYNFTEDNKLTLLEEVRASAELKLDMVRQAKHHIHIMTYFWDKKGYPVQLIRELKKAHDRGVDVRIITTYLPSFAKDFFGKSARDLLAGYNFNIPGPTLAYMKFRPGENGSVTNNIHEKIFLIDGEKAILGGRNISDSSFRGKDLEVMLEGPIVNQVQEHFWKMFSFLVELEISKNCSNRKSSCFESYNKLRFGIGDKKFFPDQPHYLDGPRARILTNEVLIDQAINGYLGDARPNVKDDIIDTIININFTKMRAYNYFIIPTERYKNFLLKNLADGKSIDIITNSMNTASVISNKGYLFGLPEMLNLVDHGLNLHEWLGAKKGEKGDQLFYLHEKVMLFDDNHGIIGSHNFGVGSTAVSSEIAIEFFSNTMVSSLNDIFDNEVSSIELTKKATSPILKQEINKNQKIINFLHSKKIKNFIQELY